MTAAYARLTYCGRQGALPKSQAAAAMLFTAAAVFCYQANGKGFTAMLRKAEGCKWQRVGTEGSRQCGSKSVWRTQYVYVRFAKSAFGCNSTAGGKVKWQYKSSLQTFERYLSVVYGKQGSSFC
jgi:hypothetical protein